MTDTELVHALALLKTDGVGDIIAKKLINHCGSAENIFNSKATFLKGIDGIGSVLLKKLKDKSTFEKAVSEFNYIKENNINVVYFLEEDYKKRFSY